MKLKDIGGHIVSGVIGTAIGYFITQITSKDIGQVVAALCLTLVIGLIALAAGKGASQTTEMLNMMRSQAPQIAIYWSTSLERAEIYEASFKLINEAKESIRIVSFHRSEYIRSSSRDSYFDRLEEILQQKQARNQRFLYQRIFQVPDETSEPSESLLGKREFSHYEKLKALSVKGFRAPTKIRFSISSAKVNTSMIVVDGRAALIGILQATESGLILSMAIEISDQTGRLIEPFTELLDSIEREARALP